MDKKTTGLHWRLPAEWEPQEGVQLTWPHAGTDWAPILNDIIVVYHSMAREIARRERLIVVAPEDAARDCLKIVCPTNDTWARDHGFISLVDDNGHRRLLDYKFNGWGEKYSDNLDFVLEGGSIESDGRGTIFTTSQCLLAPHRNQPMTKAEIEERLRRDLCAERVLWIDYGNLIGDDTDGHIDTIVRVCPDDTLLYMGCDNPEDEQYEDLRKMEAQLQSFRTLEGKPYRLMKLPMPHPIYDGEDRLPATYANFLIINDAVLCPTYNQPDIDSEALRIIAKAFPDREIIGIDCCPVIRQHGSLHCCTMQFPKI